MLVAYSLAKSLKPLKEGGAYFGSQLEDTLHNLREETETGAHRSWSWSQCVPSQDTERHSMQLLSSTLSLIRSWIQAPEMELSTFREGLPLPQLT